MSRPSLQHSVNLQVNLSWWGKLDMSPNCMSAEPVPLLIEVSFLCGTGEASLFKLLLDVFAVHSILLSVKLPFSRNLKTRLSMWNIIVSSFDVFISYWDTQNLSRLMSNGRAV